MYNRRVLAGEFAVVNKHLLRDLTQRGLWNSAVRNQIIADQGSVQRVDIPKDLKVYRASGLGQRAISTSCHSLIGISTVTVPETRGSWPEEWLLMSSCCSLGARGPRALSRPQLLTSPLV